MAIGKWFIPRKVRRVAHPVGYAKRRMTPKPVRKVMQVRHPLGTLSSAATLSVVGSKRTSKRSRRAGTTTRAARTMPPARLTTSRRPKARRRRIVLRLVVLEVLFLGSAAFAYTVGNVALDVFVSLVALWGGALLLSVVLRP
jgi:hypothetical protein